MSGGTMARGPATPLPSLPVVLAQKRLPSPYRLSPKLRELVKRLGTEVPTLVDRTLRAVQDEVPEYAAISEESLLAEVRAVIEVNARIWYGTLLAGHPPELEDLEDLARFARRRVAQGIPLAAMLQSFRVGAQTFWRAMLDEAQADGDVVPEMLFVVSSYAFAHADLVSMAVSHAYADELNSHVRRQDRIRHEFFDLLLNVSADDGAADDELRARLLTSKINLDDEYLGIALLVELPAEEFDAREDPYRSWREQLLFQLSLQRDAVIDTVRERCCLLLAPFLAEDTLRGEHETGGLLERLAAVRLDPPLIAVGLGVPGYGAAGWRRSCLQALRAIHVGMRICPSRLVHRYAELAVYDAALRSPDIADCLRLVARELLADETLSVTVMEYFRHGAHTRSAARALNVHPNTLLYRLRKVERLLGGRFDDPDWSLQVQLAVKLLVTPRTRRDKLRAAAPARCALAQEGSCRWP